jgi:hypothetical protein
MLNLSKMMKLMHALPMYVSSLYAYTFVQLGFSVSHWQKVQLNTDLFSSMTEYLYTFMDS